MKSNVSQVSRFGEVRRLQSTAQNTCSQQWSRIKSYTMASVYCRREKSYGKVFEIEKLDCDKQKRKFFRLK